MRSASLENLPALAALLVAVLSSPNAACERPLPNWFISPNLHNMKVGDEAHLQVLDNAFQEVAPDKWSLSNGEIVEMRVIGKRVVLKALHNGEVTITAIKGHDHRSAVVSIWEEIPKGKSTWAVPKQFGHVLGSHNADYWDPEDSENGPFAYALYEVGMQRTVHAFTNDGIQLWSWLPAKRSSRKLDVICANHVGGTMVKQQGKLDFEINDLDNQGRIRWTYSGDGEMDAHALYDQFYMAQASPDHTQVAIVGLNPETGTEIFRHQLPTSHLNMRNVIDQAGVPTCMPGHSIETLIPIRASLLHVNVDGDVYMAFTKRFRVVDGADYPAGEPLNLKNVRVSRDESLILVRVSRNGESTSTFLEEQREDDITAERGNFSTIQPTGEIILDGVGGVLVSVQVLHAGVFSKESEKAAEFIYRVTDQGMLAYKFRVPSYAGVLRDSMRSEDGTAFLTRGSLVVCFDAITGADLWHYDTSVPGIQVTAALSDGGVMVQGSGEAIIVHANAVERVDVDGIGLLSIFLSSRGAEPW
jgi:hypothetical protein